MEQIGYVILESAINAETKIIAQNDKRVTAETILQDADLENRNGRIYRQKDLAREIVSPRLQELVNAKEFKGEAGHPTDSAIARQQTILPNLCCFRMDKLWMDGKNVMAHVRGTNNALGQEFDEDLREGGKKAFSLRALGNILSEKGKNYVDNLKIITYDHVIFPSHRTAYTTRLLNECAKQESNMVVNEAVGNMISNNKVQYEENESGILIPITNESVISYLKAESANLDKVFSTFDTLLESMKVIDNGRNVQLVTRNAETLVIKLENYIQDELMNYSFRG